MNMITASIIWTALILGAVAIMTAMHLHDFAADCAANGGTFSNEGATAWCRY